MRYQRYAPIAAAAALLLALACDKTSEPLSPATGPSFAAGGSVKNQKADGHAVLTNGPTFLETYTFDAKAKDGVYSGHISATFENIGPLPDAFIEGDVTCLEIVPGTTHARMTAHVTSSGNFDIDGEYVDWTVTDGGNGPNAAQDAAGFIDVSINQNGTCSFQPELPEQPNDQNDIKVKP